MLLVWKKGMGMNWYLEVLKNFAAFDGRAGREEFWHFILINIAVCSALYAAYSSLWAIYAMVVLMPTIAVSVRRLHDIGRSGWWLIVVANPVLGFVYLFFMMQDGAHGANQYGFNPKDVIV
jgi:uncharacterized membrane protein YhaH (DUF805 family)